MTPWPDPMTEHMTHLKNNTMSPWPTKIVIWGQFRTLGMFFIVNLPKWSAERQKKWLSNIALKAFPGLQYFCNKINFEKNLQRGFLPHRWYICRGRMSPWHSSFIQNKRGPIFRLSEYRELPLPIPGPGSLLPAPTCLYKKLNLGAGLVD